MGKDDDIFGLLKVPDAEIIKQLRFDIGLLTSERDEALYELKILKENPIEHKQSENSAFIFSLQGQVRNLKSRIEQLENGESIAWQRIEIDRLNKMNNSNLRLIETLRSELFKYAKEHINV